MMKRLIDYGICIALGVAGGLTLKSCEPYNLYGYKAEKQSEHFLKSLETLPPQRVLPLLKILDTDKDKTVTLDELLRYQNNCAGKITI